MKATLPPWANEVIAHYESGSAGCFVLHGNVDDRFYLPVNVPRLGTLSEFLSEVDLKRPGRIDIKIPIFPAIEENESLALLRALSGKRGLKLTGPEWDQLRQHLPLLLTAGGAEALAVKAIRLVKTKTHAPFEAMHHILTTSRPPIPFETLKAQMRLAVHEATESEFVTDEVHDLLD